jgi:hypothetical protein
MALIVELVGGPENGRIIEIPEHVRSPHVLVDPVRHADRPELDVVVDSEFGALQRAAGRHWPIYAARDDSPGRMFWVQYFGPGHP